MQLNPLVKTAAKDAVVSGIVIDMPVAIPGYPGMFVAQAEIQDIQQMHFFAHDGTRYAIGPKKIV
jgi:hypothetical protein